MTDKNHLEIARMNVEDWKEQVEYNRNNLDESLEKLAYWQSILFTNKRTADTTPVIISQERLWELGLAFNKASYPTFSGFDPSSEQLGGLKAVLLELGYQVEE